MDSVEDVIEDLSGLPVADDQEDRRRVECSRCNRPTIACWCSSLPQPPLDVSCNVVVLQHPFEERRALRTAPMILHGLAPGKCRIYRGKRFSAERYPALTAVLDSADTVVLYPGSDAADIRDLSPVGPLHPRPYNIVILDGTWRQAKSIYFSSPALHSLKRVQIVGCLYSSYVVRTQPTESCLSTVESAAACLQQLEGRPGLSAQLLAPLHALCRVQLLHGAAPHDSRQTVQLRAAEYHKLPGNGTRRAARPLGVVL